MEPEPSPHPRPERRNRVRSPEVWAAIRTDVEDGMSFPHAAIKYGVRKDTIRYHAKNEGWLRRDIDRAKDAAFLQALADQAASPAPEPEPEPDLTPMLRLVEDTQRAYQDALRRKNACDAHHWSQALSNLRRTTGLSRARSADPEPPLPDSPAAPWLDQAHEAQRPPPEPWRTWVFMGGRGAGKTRAGAEWLDALAQNAPGARFALIAPTFHDAREVMVGGESGLRNLPRPGRPRWETARRRLVWPNDATAQAFSAEDPESLRGPQHHAAWADEFCAWRDPGVVLPLLRMGLRLTWGVGGGVSGAHAATVDDPRHPTPHPPHPQLMITTTPKPIASLRALLAEPLCQVSRAPTAANAAALPASFLSDLHALYGGTRLAAQELDGLIVEGEGALWRAEELARARGPAPERMERVVVAVDPPATAGGDACGIVAAGRRDGRAYVLEDATVRGLSPLGWAARAADAARRWKADTIVAESNQGGEMVRATLRLAGCPCPVELAHAGRSKRARAEPVAALYEQGRVTHCPPAPGGQDLGALEEELMALGLAETGPSPDRADALVWALTALMLNDSPEPRLRVV